MKYETLEDEKGWLVKVFENNVVYINARRFEDKTDPAGQEAITKWLKISRKRLTKLIRNNDKYYLVD